MQGTKVTPDESNNFGVATENEKDESVPLQTAETIVAKSPADKTAAIGPNLLENHPSVIKLRVINAAGPSEASDPANTVVTKPRNMASQIDRTNFHDTKIKVGETISFDIKVS